MRHIASLLAVSTLILASTSIYLYQQLEAARELARRDAASENERCGPGARLEQIRGAFETVLRAPNSGRPLAAATTTSPRAAPETLPTNLPRVADMTGEQRLELVHRRYRRIFGELELSDAEVAAILPVLGQHDLGAHKPLPNEIVGRPQQEPQSDQSDLAAVLGAEKAERFTALRKLQPARSEVSMLQRRLEDSGHPLSADQQEELLGRLAAKSAEPASQRIEGIEPQPSIERMNAWMRERDQRLRQDAAPVLTAAQRQLLEQDDAFQDAMRTRTAAIVTPQAGSSAPAAYVP